ncbi:MAG TPA: DNA-3-methyladenine glycosylase [Burkholderiales bacterium]|nr:DNA-3-methyladenine glycosylase [Burkholderiales bacterium]
MNKLDRNFYEGKTEAVAQALLGMYLVHHVDARPRIGRIVEVEAYLGPQDLAAHSSKGVTARTRVMFGPAGHAYVYQIYGLHYCMNVVTEGATGTAVLLRALEPVENLPERTQGPALLCKAMQIDRRQNGMDLLSETFYIARPDESPSFTIVRRPRIGVDYAGQWARRLLRFYVRGNPFVSRA